MNLQEEVVIPRDRETVYRALNDPDILKVSIPGCEELVMLSDTEVEATVVVRFGPVKASFSSTVTLDASDHPDRFRLSGKGEAGVAGAATGSADVSLAEQGKDTVLSYAVNIDVVGKLAQLGSRLMESTTRKLAKKFFSNFEAALTAEDDSAADLPPA